MRIGSDGILWSVEKSDHNISPASHHYYSSNGTGGGAISAGKADVFSYLRKASFIIKYGLRLTCLHAAAQPSQSLSSIHILFADTSGLYSLGMFPSRYSIISSISDSEENPTITESICFFENT